MQTPEKVFKKMPQPVSAPKSALLIKREIKLEVEVLQAVEQGYANIH